MPLSCVKPPFFTAWPLPAPFLSVPSPNMVKYDLKGKCLDDECDWSVEPPHVKCTQFVVENDDTVRPPHADDLCQCGCTRAKHARIRRVRCCYIPAFGRANTRFQVDDTTQSQGSAPTPSNYKPDPFRAAYQVRLHPFIWLLHS